MTEQTVVETTTTTAPGTGKKPLSAREQSSLRKLVAIDKAAAQARVEQEAAAWKREQVALLDSKFAALHEAKDGEEVIDLSNSMNTAVSTAKTEYFAAVKALEEKRDAKVTAIREKFVKSVEKMGLAVEVTNPYNREPQYAIVVPGYTDAKAKIDAQAREVVEEAKRRLTMSLADSERTILLAGLTGSVAAEQVLTEISGVADGALKALVSGKVEKTEPKPIVEGGQIFVAKAQVYSESRGRYVPMEQKMLTVDSILNGRGSQVIKAHDDKDNCFQVMINDAIGV